MTAIPLLNGIKADNRANLRQSLPINLEPTLIESGLSKGYLRSPPGITAVGNGPGRDRGAINWNGVEYRVMGSKLVSVDADGGVTVLGEVGDDGKPASLDYSFDRLIIGSNADLFYWDGAALAQVTDVDLGDVVDAIWVDGYTMTTDGTSIVVTELNDPTAVDPLKYGSSEADPDGVKGLLRLPGEVTALNRYTIEFFRNVGGNGFPFARIPSAMINKGCVGTFAKTLFGDSFAFVGGGRNQAVSVYLAGGGTAAQIGVPVVDDALAALSEAELAAVELERRKEQDEERLLVHLPNGPTFVFLMGATAKAGEPVWYQLGAGPLGADAYPLRHLCLVYGAWRGGTTAGALGRLDRDVQSQFGDLAGWQFETLFVNSKARDCILGTLELVGLPGRTPFGTDPKVTLSFTRDGETYSVERAASMGGFGVRRERVVYRPNVRANKYLGLRFRGANTAFASFAALEADIEALA